MIVPIPDDGRATIMRGLDANQAQIAVGSLVVVLIALLFLGVMALVVDLVRRPR